MGKREMRTTFKWLVAITATLSVGIQSASAGFVGKPLALGKTVQRISLKNYTLPPMAFTQFCIRYADQCKPQQIAFRGGPVRLTSERWNDLKEINMRVNAAIIPEANTEGLAGEKWLIGPGRGDCNDYAVTKRFQLLALGWPARSLLLSEVVVASGEHHLVLVVRTTAGDFVLDNLSAQIRPWSRAPYQWVRIQTPKNPNYWATLGTRNA